MALRPVAPGCARSARAERTQFLRSACRLQPAWHSLPDHREVATAPGTVVRNEPKLLHHVAWRCVALHLQPAHVQNEPTEAVVSGRLSVVRGEDRGWR